MNIRLLARSRPGERGRGLGRREGRCKVVNRSHHVERAEQTKNHEVEPGDTAEAAISTSGRLGSDEGKVSDAEAALKLPYRISCISVVTMLRVGPEDRKRCHNEADHENCPSEKRRLGLAEQSDSRRDDGRVQDDVITRPVR
ncbi:MAG TPA: hypothetical protein VMW75_03570, partial [Thermoanaerobaculia bacterium]|nr:hypothetical protein [Thermoanaerobaculia bacterium]